MVQRTFGAKYTPDDVYAGNLFSALGAIDSGVTCILDWSHIHNTPAHSDAAVKALFDSGARAVFAYGNGQNETGRYWEIAASKFPGDTWRGGPSPGPCGHCSSLCSIVSDAPLQP